MKGTSTEGIFTGVGDEMCQVPMSLPMPMSVHQAEQIW